VSLSIPSRRSRALSRPMSGQLVGGHGVWIDKAVTLKVFAASFVLNLTAALVLAYAWGVGNADALSRTTNASYVLFSRDPHLAAVGFVWPVLPSMLQLPFLPPLHLLGHPEAAGFVVSSIAGAGILAVLAAILGEFGVRGWTRLALLAAVQFHPQMWYLSASGMSEPLSTFFLLLAVYFFLSAATNVLAPAALGLSLAAAFFVRYEVLSTTAATVLALVFQRWPAGPAEMESVGKGGVGRGSRLLRWLPGRWTPLEGRVLTVATPLVYAVLLWMLANWIIMGDPLYFNDSPFSLAKAPDVARNNGPGYPLYSQIHAPLLTLAYALTRLTQANIAFVVLGAPVVLLAWRKGDRRLLGVMVIALGTFSLPTAEVYLGSLPPYLRYWSLATPFAAVLAGGMLALLPRGRPASVARYGVVVLVLCGALANVVGLSGWPNGNNNRYGNGYGLIGELTGNTSLDEQRLAARLTGNVGLDHYYQNRDYSSQKRHDGALLAAALDRYSARGLTLIDTETGFSGIVYSHHPERLAISSDRDFPQILRDPRRYLRYIFLATPDSGKGRDFINQRYQGMWEDRLPWARDLGPIKGTVVPWRIYTVLPRGHGRGVARGGNVAANGGAQSLGTRWYLPDGASTISSDRPLIVEQVTYGNRPGKPAYAPAVSPRAHDPARPQ